MKIVVNAQIHLSEIRSTDKESIVRCLNDKDIYDRTLRLPYPYTDADADAWFGKVERATREQGQPVSWAIRDDDEQLIGGLGFDELSIGKSHRAEIGYWLAKPLWGRGIMTAVVTRVCQYAFEEWGLVKITAYVFAGNRASARVLEKCGFDLEGRLKKHFRKENVLLDANLYALLQGEMAFRPRGAAECRHG